MPMNKSKNPVLYSSGPQVDWDSPQNANVTQRDTMNKLLVTHHAITSGNFFLFPQVCLKSKKKNVNAAAVVKDAPTIPKKIG